MTNIGGNTFVAIVVHLLDILNGQVPQKGFLVQRARIFLRLLVTEIRSEVFSFELTGHHKGQHSHWCAAHDSEVFTGW